MKGREDRATAALARVLNSCEVTVRAAVVEALMAGVPRPARTFDPRHVTLRATALTGPSRPDLVLHDDGGRIRVVVEHKLRAQESCVPVAPYRRLPPSARFDDPYAEAFSLVPADEAADLPHEHPPRAVWKDEGCPLGCTLHKTVRSSGGRVVTVISQLDRYRVFRGWVDDLFPHLTLPNARDAVWLLLDQRGRSLATAADASYSAEAGEWSTTGHLQLLPVLRGLHAQLGPPHVQHLDELLELCA